MGFFKLFSNKKGKGSPIDFSVKDSSAYDFLWTIHSFSKLNVANKSCRFSGAFEYKGYSWVLVLYPNGKIRNDKLSLYLMQKRTPTPSYPYETVFKVSYELFLFDMNTGGKLSKKAEHLGKVNEELGFQSLIDLTAFRDSSKGYLVNDSCMFGVKFMCVVPIKTHTECHYPVENISHEHTWKIDNFSKLDLKIRHERHFTAGDNNWSIFFYQEEANFNGNKVKAKNVSLYLKYYGSIDNTSAMKVSAEMSLSIINQIGGNHKVMTCNSVFNCSGAGYGWGEFMPLEVFHDTTKGFLVEDTCVIKAKVKVLAIVK